MFIYKPKSGKVTRTIIEILGRKHDEIFDGCFIYAISVPLRHW